MRGTQKKRRLGDWTFDDAELTKFYGVDVLAMPFGKRYFYATAKPVVEARLRLREGLFGLEPDQVIDLAMKAYDDDDFAQELACQRMQQIMEEKSRSTNTDAQ